MANCVYVTARTTTLGELRQKFKRKPNSVQCKASVLAEEKGICKVKVSEAASVHKLTPGAQKK